MKRIAPFVILIFFIGCSQKPNRYSIGSSNEPWFLIDSLYKFHNYIGKLTDTDQQQKLIPIDSNAIKILLSKMKGFSPDYWHLYYRVDYFSKQKKINQLQPIVIYASGDDYWSFLMIILGEDNKVISYKEIQGGPYVGPDNYDDRMEIESNFCNIIDGQSIDYFRIKSIYPNIDSDHTTDFRTMHDSISYHISIDTAGIFYTKLLDSIRLKD